MAFPDISCSGTDPSAGLELAQTWTSGEQRDLIFSESSSGAGISPSMNGVVSTTPITITAIDADATSATLRWSPGDSQFDDASIDPEEQGMDEVDIDFLVNGSGSVVGIDNLDVAIETLDTAFVSTASDEQLIDRLGEEFTIYQFPETPVSEGEVTNVASQMQNPVQGELTDTTDTTEHLGIDEQGCEVVRVTQSFGPDVIAENLEMILEGLSDAEMRSMAFADIGFEGALIRTTTYRYDHGIDRVRQVEFTQAWGVFGAGGVDSRLETRVFTDVTDS